FTGSLALESDAPLSTVTAGAAALAAEPDPLAPALAALPLGASPAVRAALPALPTAEPVADPAAEPRPSPLPGEPRSLARSALNPPPLGSSGAALLPTLLPLPTARGAAFPGSALLQETQGIRAARIAAARARIACVYHTRKVSERRLFSNRRSQKR